MLPSGASFGANTGVSAYDTVRFSGMPDAEAVVPAIALPKHELQLVRHMGIKGSGTAHAQDHHPDAHKVMVNLTSSGRLRGRIGDVRVDAMLRRGAVNFLPGFLPAEIEFPAGHGVLALIIPAATVARFMNEAGASDLRPMISQKDERLAQLVGMVETEIRSPGFAADVLIDGLQRAICAIVGRHDPVLALQNADRIHLSPARLAKIKNYVEANLDQRIGIADMAQVAGLSPFHFSRVFKLATGQTPYQFLARWRIDHARTLLQQGDMPLAEMALACGFSNQAHFTAAFTKAVGAPPGRFRRLPD